ncbi:hypothetical protein BYT27DRAFT_7205923 [Phlegmacium glaucopus]|nr:hypothetical protein BYT27DRAFT_7205923 [Phlegmacium glaucopus]
MTSPSTRLPSLMPVRVKDQFTGHDFGDGWTKHIAPHNDPGLAEYFHNKDLNVVTTKRLYNHQDRNEFGLDCRSERVRRKIPPEVELFMDGNKIVAEVAHDLQTYSLDNDGFSTIGKRGQYWAYIATFSCHHTPPPDAKNDALLVLHSMTLQNLANSLKLPSTPFSPQHIENFKEFLSSEDLKLPFSDTVIIAIILAGYYRHQLGRNIPNNPDTGKQSWLLRLFKIIVKVSCCGMPPDYYRRFQVACNTYRRTLQVAHWQSFVAQVRSERAAANVMSGLLLASSVAFLAIPGLVDVAQFFIIASIGLALGSVVMGFNIKVDEKLSELEQIIIERPEDNDKTLKNTAGAMEQHYSVLLLSVLCFFLSVFVFTTYSIYSSVFLTKAFTVRYFFYAMATGTLILMLVVTTIWNRRFKLAPSDSSSNV